MKNYLFLTMFAFSISSLAHANSNLKIDLNIVSESAVGKPIGYILIKEDEKGLIFTPNLSNLPAGEHGFHIHENPSCLPLEKDGKWIAGLSAGGHWDPTKSNIHSGPYGDGHLGDLPSLIVDNNGKSIKELTAPRLKSLDQIKGHSIMIHLGGDNHSDHPAPLGGGGARIACGLIE